MYHVEFCLSFYLLEITEKCSTRNDSLTQMSTLEDDVLQVILLDAVMAVIFIIIF